MDISIVGVLYGGISVLESTLQSWRDSTIPGVEFIFVDNSSDRLDKYIDFKSWARYVWFPDNLGFAGGANVGAQMATADRVLFLNPDVFLDRPSLGAILDLDPDSVWALGLLTAGVVGRGISYNRFGFYSDRSDVRSCLVGPSGGGAIFPKETFLSLGGFPEHLFAWGEDAELAIVAYSSGHMTRESEVVLRHVGGHSVASHDGQRLKARLLVRNRIATFRRVLDRRTKAVMLIPFALAIALNSLRKVRQGTFRPYLRGAIEGFFMPLPPLGRDPLRLRDWRKLSGRPRKRS